MSGAVRAWGAARLPSWTLLAALGGLLTIGVIFVQSATAGSEGTFPGPLTKVHLSRIALGMVLFLIFLRLDYRRLEHLAGPCYLAAVAVLAALLAHKFFTGAGVARWIRLPYFTFQPSEPMKLFAILLLARMLKPLGNLGLDPPVRSAVFVVALPVFLVALQPDLGTALVLPPALLVMLWISGTSARRLLVSVLVLVVVALPAAPLVLREYQMARVKSFVRPLVPDSLVTFGHLRDLTLFPGLEPGASSRSFTSYQVEQSIIAIGSGGPTGKGLYLGTINYLDTLPENHNDFIFAVVGEEWGLRGTLLVLALFTILYVGMLRIAYRTREAFGRLVIVGITTQLAFQTVVNLFMTIGMAPVTGLPLPFLSYGGSAMITSIAEVGIVIGIGMRPVRVLHPDGLRSGTSTGYLRTSLGRR